MLRHSDGAPRIQNLQEALKRETPSVHGFAAHL